MCIRQKIDTFSESFCIESGKAYLKKEEYGLAKREFDKAIKFNSRSLQAYFELGKIYCIEKNWCAAMEMLRKAISYNPNNIYAHSLLGKTYKMLNKYDCSIKEFKKGMELGGFDIEEIHIELAEIYEKLGDSESAIKEFKNAIKLKPDKSKMRIELARFYQRNQKYEAALREFREAGALENEDADIHLDIGRVYREKGEFNYGLKELKVAQRLDPDNSRIHFELALLYESCNDQNSMTKELEIASKLNPDDGQIHFKLGLIYTRMTKYKFAIKKLKKAIKCGFDNEKILIELGRIYREKGRDRQAIKEFKKLFESNSRDLSPYLENKILNEIEISQKKIILESKPRGLGVTLTSRCNLKCPMCGFHKNSWDMPSKRINEIVNWFPYLDRIYWQGGEVFILDYFEELFDKAATYPNLKQIIKTNGLLLDERWAKKIASPNVNITFSIDGFTKETYEPIRYGARFEDLIKNISALKRYKEDCNNNTSSENKMITGINFIVMKSNYCELSYIVDFAIKYGFESLAINPLFPGSYPEEDIFSQKNTSALKYVKRVMPEVIKKAKKHGIRVDTCDNFYVESLDSREAELSLNHSVSRVSLFDRRISCYLPWQQLFIDLGGITRIHRLCLKEIGNINDASLQEIWNNNMMQVYRKKLLENNRGDLCGQGCISGTSPQLI